MLTAIENDRLYWRCLRYDEDGNLISCGKAKSAVLSEAVYHSPAHEGAVIALPRCECGTQCFLKADYTVKELSKVVCAVTNEQGIWAYVLPLRYVRNLRLHWMLYVRGKASHAPVLPMPAEELLARPEIYEIDTDVAHAFWVGFLVAKRHSLKLSTRETQKALGTCNN